MIVLDEFQFIARQEPEIGSLLNRFAQEHEDNGDLLLCLSGSDVSFFERLVIGYGATTYGRRTGGLRLQPFPWQDIGAFTEGWSVEDRIRAWAVFGGVPYYLKEIDPSLGLADAIRASVLYPDGLLHEEPRFLLSQEGRLREVATYMSCLRAIAGGVTRLNAIAQRIGKTRSEEARPFLETLEEMGLVERRHPVTQGSSKKVSYAIADPFLRFWFRFVAPRESRLQTRSDADDYLDDVVLPELDKFVSEDAFERICQGWLLRQLDSAVEAGRWWGSIRRRENGKLRSRAFEADAVAIDSQGGVLALGSCKWPDQKTADHVHDADELDKLEAVRTALGAPDAHLYFFDRLSFSSRLRELEEEREDVHLVLAEQLG
jgi:AAA+ ATPase superfamily predicted ATPase